MKVSEVLGGLSDDIWGKQYHQQDRVYSVSDISQCLSAQFPGGAMKILEIKIDMKERIGNSLEQSRAEQSRAEFVRGYAW